jgi:hypothetical protein
VDGIEYVSYKVRLLNLFEGSRSLRLRYVHRRRFEGAVNTNRDIQYFVPLTRDITFKFLTNISGQQFLNIPPTFTFKIYVTEIKLVTPIFRPSGLSTIYGKP